MTKKKKKNLTKLNLSRNTSSEIHNAYNSIANSNSSTLLRPRLQAPFVCHVMLPHKIESHPLDALQWNPLISFYGANSVGLFLCNSILHCLNTGTDLNVTAAEAHTGESQSRKQLSKG